MVREYSRPEIDLFVSTNLQIVGIDDDVRKKQIRLDFADTIERLPPWQQTVMIESRRTNVVGDSASINYAYKTFGSSNHQSVLGFFAPGTMSLKFNNAAEIKAVDPIIWGPDRGATLYHEEGHRIDRSLAKEHQLKDEYFSNTFANWKEAVALEKERSTKGDNGEKLGKSSIPKRIRGFFQREAEEETPGAPLYADYRTLSSHLSMYDEDKHTIESFAEMSAHYGALYSKYNGDEKKVDKTLSKHYPFLWPVYRDEVIPLVQDLAEKTYGKTAQKIELYEKEAQRHFEILQTPDIHNPETARRKARELSLKGTIDENIDAIKYRSEVFSDPLPHYLRSRQALFEKRMEMKGADLNLPENHYPDNAEEEQAKAILSSKGKIALGRIHLLQKDESRALSRFDTLYNRLANELGITEDEKAQPASRFSPASILASFDSLKKSGGIATVQASMDLIPPSKQVLGYSRLREENYLARAELELGASTSRNIPPKFKEDLAQEILTIVGKGQSSSLESELQSLSRENKLLSRYQATLDSLIDRISESTGGKVSYIPGKTILMRFDELVEKGGLDAVQAQIDKLSVRTRTIDQYTIQAENRAGIDNAIKREEGSMSYGRKGGVYHPLDINETDLPEGFRHALTAEIFRAVYQEGEGALERRIAQMKIETHDIIGKAIGKPLPIPSNLLDNAKGIPDVVPETSRMSANLQLSL